MADNRIDLQVNPQDARQFPRVCSRFASGATILTVVDSTGVPHGMTASSFNMVSFNPPLILLCVACGAGFLEAFNSSGHFGINILDETQRSLSERFARVGHDRFDGVIWNPGTTGVPLFPSMLATMECAPFKTFTAGDHEILIGEVLHAEWREGEPLIHFGSQYRALESSPTWWSTI